MALKSIKNEAAVLRCYLYENSLLDESILHADDFTNAKHKSCFNAMNNLYAESGGFDPITFKNYASTYEKIDKVYLTQLFDVQAMAFNIKKYEKAVKEASFLRNLNTAGLKLQDLAKTPNSTLDKTIANAETICGEAVDNHVSSKHVPLVERIDTVREMVDFAKSNPGIQGMHTPIHTWTETLGGLKTNTMNVLAARPAVGKTTMALNIVRTLCVENSTPVGFLSLEMTAEQLVTKLACQISGDNHEKVLQGVVSDEFYDALERVRAAELEVYDFSDMTVARMRGLMRKQHRKHKTKVWILDYLQLLMPSGFNKQRYQQIGELCRGFRAQLLEINGVGIALSQLRRESEGNKTTPTLRDLRESGDIEQDADTVSLMWNKDGEEINFVRPVSMLVAKNRFGRTGYVNIDFHLQTGVMKETVPEFVKEDELPY